MPYKMNTSESITTTSSIGVNAKGKAYQTSSSTTSSTTSKRKLTRGESARGILTTIGQIQMIGITILVLAIGSAVDDFTLSDLNQTNPNYQLTNTYVGYDDPLTEINYQQYGEGVFGRFFGPTGFITLLDGLGTTAQNVAVCLSDIVACITAARELGDIYDDDINNPLPDSFVDTFGADRYYALNVLASSSFGGRQNPYYIYQQMTTAEREYVRDNATYSLAEQVLFLDYQPDYFYIFGFTNPFTSQWQWGYYKWPSIRQTIINLGV